MRRALEQATTDCLETFTACEETLEYCLRGGGALAKRELVNSLISCAAVCDAAAYFSRNSELLRREALRLCAELNDRCADACERIPDDDRLADCARLCRKCARSCRRSLFSLT